jgi:hypothetical protein
MKDVGKYYGHLVYFATIYYYYILWSFVIFCCHLVYLTRFNLLYQEKSGNPGRFENC